MDSGIANIIKNYSKNMVSDIHIKLNENIFFRQNGDLLESSIYVDNERLETYLDYLLDKTEKERLNLAEDINKTIQIENIRIRCNSFLSNGKPSIAIRIINDEVIKLENLEIYEEINSLIENLSGLILITGISGSGKTMTMNSIIDYINRNFSYNILMLEDPIEYLHKTDNSLINQREIINDTVSYTEALKSSLRQDPDIIALGEMRSLDSIKIALTAAETGHLVISTLHTMGTSKTIDRIIDVFPSQQQNQIRLQVSTVLRGVFSQKLIREGDGRRAVFDKLIINHAIKNLIRENKTYQIDNIYRQI